MVFSYENSTFFSFFYASLTDLCMADLNAYCPGRMLLPGNYWLEEVPAIAVKHPCARHALLAFSISYVLDYEPTEAMRIRANHHYSTAVKLLENALNRETTYAVGQDDGVVAAMILILSNDVSDR